MDRRQFLKGLSGAVVAGAAVAAGCDHPNAVIAEGYTPGEVPTDKMSMRTDSHGQQVSFLGFGMMRLPVEGGGDLRSNPNAKLDQEAINQMVDYAIEHGVNYFDTAPVYLRGMSEAATGIALARHPRDRWLVATKMSNFRDWSYEASIEMYHHSFEYLQVDHIDYYLLHSFGGVDKETGKSDFEKRFVDNGVLDFLVKEREPNRSLASWSWRHLGMYPRILTALSGMNLMEHLQDNIRSCAPLEPLNADELALLDRVADEFAHFPAIPCTSCQYCMPCPYGLDIPGIFAHYNKCLTEGNIATEGTVEQREFRRARRAFLTSYDKNIARLRQADHCIDCGECLKHCPQSIKIPEKMHMIEDYTNKLKDSLV